MPSRSLEVVSCRRWRSTSNAAPTSPPEALGVCAKLKAVNGNGGQVILLSIGRPVSIGRNPDLCNYVIPDIVVSSVHCKLYATASEGGGSIISCQDLSTNGIILNGHRMRKTSVILMDGDTLEIPHSQRFTCVHMHKHAREKTHIFEPTPTTQVKKKRMGNYIVTSNCLGSGNYGAVYLAIDTVAHRQAACKSIKAKSEAEIKTVFKEFSILMALQHPNINEVYDIQIEGIFLHIFLQLCTGGDLFTYIVSRPESSQRLIEGEAKYIMFQLLKALEYLHDRQISHRDLKPENILLYCPGPYPRIQIADFGLARQRAYQETFNVCGTVSYLPPEAILALDNKHLGYVGMPADCWSAGVVLYIMLSGYHPFDNGVDSFCASKHPESKSSDFVPSSLSEIHGSGDQIKHRIVSADLPFEPEIWNTILNAKRLVSQLLVQDCNHRATVYGALNSAWITSDLDELEQAYRDRVL